MIPTVRFGHRPYRPQVRRDALQSNAMEGFIPKISAHDGNGQHFFLEQAGDRLRIRVANEQGATLHALPLTADMALSPEVSDPAMQALHRQAVALLAQ